MKNTLSSDLSLVQHNPESDIIVASDASSQGIGAFILHKTPGGNITKKKQSHTLHDPYYPQKSITLILKRKPLQYFSQ